MRSLKLLQFRQQGMEDGELRDSRGARENPPRDREHGHQLYRAHTPVRHSFTVTDSLAFVRDDRGHLTVVLPETAETKL